MFAQAAFEDSSAYGAPFNEYLPQHEVPRPGLHLGGHLKSGH